MYRSIVKPAVDFLTAAILFIFLSPVFIILIILLAVTLRGNPFFTQERPGKFGKRFYVIKFRTMDNRRDTRGALLPDSVRLTGVGKWIRSTSLDELPQLINVIRGDMSLIGPRPLLIRYLPLYNDHQAKRHRVKPGITGWAQVNGRNAITWEQKFDYDVYYVDHLSFCLDVSILLLTIKKVLKREGINAANSTTMPPFQGNQ